MISRLSALVVAVVLALCTTNLVGAAAPKAKVFVTNSNDSGAGSFRDAIAQANGDAAIGTVQFKGSVSVIALASTVVFSGTQDLTILGNGARLDGGNTGGRAFEATGGGDLAVSRLIVQNSPQEGIAVVVPAGATGTVVVELNDVEILGNLGHGVHVDDQQEDGSGSAASVDVRVTKSLFRDNGYSVSDRDGLRVDEGGIGDLTITVSNSKSLDNAADGIEVDERGAGNVNVDMFGSDVSGNGVLDPADLDDGFDIDESEEGGVFGRISHSSANNNYEQGFDFNENHAGDLRVDMDHVVANGNGAEGIEYEEDDDFAGGGDIVATLFHITANGNGGAFEEDPGDAALKLREKGVGNLTTTIDHVETSNNQIAGIFIREDAAGNLVADITNATSVGNNAAFEVDGHGIDFDENSDGDLTATVSFSTSSLNAGAGVRADEGGAGVGSLVLSHVVLSENAGGATTGNVTPTFDQAAMYVGRGFPGLSAVEGSAPTVGRPLAGLRRAKRDKWRDNALMRLATLALVAVLTTSLIAESMVSDVKNVPVDRLVANLTRMAKQNPRDLEVRVNLARVYAMAYAQKLHQIPVIKGTASENEPGFRDGIDHEHMQFEVTPSRDPKVIAAARVHLSSAIKAYRDVLLVDRNNRVALIGLGWCLSQAGQTVEAVTVLRRAADVMWLHESQRDAMIGAGAGMLEEVARYLLPLLHPERDADEIARIKGRIKQLEGVPRWITPIVIPLRTGLTALDMVDDDARVVFDLDGTGPKPWTWITSEAAWLVYDHFDERRITSGLQLFGNVTFWAFWQNGYHALRALDDDGDGRVRGSELRGLALWHDRNSNGVSDRGEVRPVAAWGIEALSTAYQFDATHPAEIPWSSAGVRFTDGTVRPTFDAVLRRRP